MKRTLCSLLACGALWLLVPAAAFAQPLPVKTVEFNSESVGRKMKYNIVLPAKYDQTSDRYPVLYLLHGLTGNYTNWSTMGVPKYARAYDLIVVMPDGGNSWYVNWAKSEDGQKNNWEDAIVKDLVGHVDATYRTIAKREGRAINGLSMGGYGGLMLGLKHPEMFCSIGSHSGALTYARQAAERFKSGKDTPKKAGKAPSTTPDPKIGIEGFSSQVERTPKGQMFANAENCTAYDPFDLVVKLPRDKLPHIYIDCGTEDGLIKGARELAKLLMEKNIPFTYAESPGAHNGAYWTREVAHSMAVQNAIIQRQLALAAKGVGQGKEQERKGGQ
jgi:putative tributyrin esterase